MVSHLPIAALSVDLVSDFRQLTAYPFMVNALEAGTIVAVDGRRGRLVHGAPA